MIYSTHFVIINKKFGDNMFKYTLDNKRYHTLNYYYKQKYGKKVFKVPIDAHLGCPNKGKCIYCSGDFNNHINDDITNQFEKELKIMLNKWPDAYYIAYLQSDTNTYGPINKLKDIYEKLLSFDNVIGLTIATRPDTINDEVLNYLIDLNKRCNLTIELGLQSMHNKTLKLINRGHNLKQFDDCVKKLKQNNIEVVVHIINGLPNETEEMMLDTIKHLNKLHIDGIKFHMLYVSKGTKLEELYNNNQIKLLTKQEYINIVIKQLELLSPEIVIHRITSDPYKKDLIEPTWLLNKRQLINDIDKEMKKRNTHQGIYYNI